MYVGITNRTLDFIMHLYTRAWTLQSVAREQSMWWLVIIGYHYPPRTLEDQRPSICYMVMDTHQ